MIHKFVVCSLAIGEKVILGMEVLLYHSGPCLVRLHLVDKKPSVCGLNPSAEKKHQMLCSTSSCRSLGVTAEPSGSFNSGGDIKLLLQEYQMKAILVMWLAEKG